MGAELTEGKNEQEIENYSVKKIKQVSLFISEGVSG